MVRRKVEYKERHVRWNWEKSPDEEEMVRYHFVVVGDEDREGTINRILMPLVNVGGAIIPVRSVEGKVKDSRFRYLFVSYDSRASSDRLDLRRLKRVVRDRDLRERVRGSIKDYVSNLFS